MFLSAQYEEKRQTVIDLFNRYSENRKKLKECVGLQDTLSKDDLEILHGQISALKSNKYLLAVVGESKSGKSAFINALLKKPLLPTGTLQCTSGIIEIIDTDNKQDNGKIYLKIKYANNSEEEEIDLSNIQDKLQEVAAIPEKYRQLPIVQLNQYLTSRKPENINDQNIEELLSWTEEHSSKPFLENPHKLSETDFRYAIKNYLDEYKDLSKIPIEITVGCPLGFEFTRLRIVDTPGVNARGGLRKATINFIVDASAVIFIHPIKNIASLSLEEFIKTAIPKHVQDNIFMFLTHKALSTEKDVQATLEEARNLFSDIKENRIIAVDSMLKRISDELLTGKSPRTLREDEEIKKLIDTYIVEYESDEERIQNAILKDSNFETIEDALRDFSERALEKQLDSIVIQIKAGYDEQKKIYQDEVYLRNEKIERKPEDFNSEIDSLKNSLELYRETLYSFGVSKRNKYTGTGSDIEEIFSVLKDDYLILLDSANDEDSIRKYLLDFGKECDKKIALQTNKLNREFTQKMNELGVEFKKNHNINVPKIDPTNILEKARKSAFETVTIPGNKALYAARDGAAGGLYGAVYGFAFGGPPGALIGALTVGTVTATQGYLAGTRSKTEKQFSEKRYKDSSVNEAKAIISDVSSKMVETIGELFDEYQKEFQEKLKIIIKERLNAYETLKTKKKEAEKLFQEIENIQTNIEELDRDLSIIADKWGRLETSN